MEDINNPRKRKPQEVGNDDKKKAKIPLDTFTCKRSTQLMKKIYDEIDKKITDINRSVLTIADLASSSSDLQSKLDSGELLLSWINKEPRLVLECVTQTEEDCWAKAFAAALSGRMIKDGRKPHELPTADLLVKNIDPSLLVGNNALRRPMDAAPSILRHYNYHMVNHTRPSLKFRTHVELFDNFIERLAAIVPLAACFPYPPSYLHFNSKLGDRKVFRPTPADIVALKIETLQVHYVVITGRGVVCIDGEYVEYWQIQETRGKSFAENGFTRFERGKGLIRQVYEFVRQ